MNATTTTPVAVGRIWWAADNAEEAARWVRDLLARGAVAVECKGGPASEGTQGIDVIITLRRDGTEVRTLYGEQGEKAGYKIGDHEWMEPIDRPRIRRLCRVIQAGYAKGYSGLEDKDGMGDAVMELSTLAEDIAALAQE
jgi:hypothetical protein